MKGVWQRHLAGERGPTAPFTATIREQAVVLARILLAVMTILFSPARRWTG